MEKHIETRVCFAYIDGTLNKTNAFFIDINGKYGKAFAVGFTSMENT